MRYIDQAFGATSMLHVTDLFHSSCSIHDRHRMAVCPALILGGCDVHLPQVQLVADSKRLQLLRWLGEVGLNGASAVESSFKGFTLTHGHEVSPSPAERRHVPGMRSAQGQVPAGAWVASICRGDMGWERAFPQSER